MFLKRLLRLPGSSCPDEALTGDEILDAYIRDFDSRLLGSKYVRLVTLSEIRDHLEQAKALGASQGLDERAASRRATTAMGSPEEQAREQRAVLRARFWRIVAVSVVPGAIMMGAYEFLMPFLRGSSLHNVAFALLSGVWFALSFSAGVFVWPGRWLGEGRELGHPAETDFNVTYPKPMLVLQSVSITLGVASIMVCGAVGTIGLLRPDSQARQFVSPWMVPVSLALLVLTACGLFREPRSFRVRLPGFEVITWGGFAADVSWQSVVAVGTFNESLTRALNWLPLMRSGKYIDYVSVSGRKHRIMVRRDMLNADRFLQAAEGHLQQNRGKPVPDPGA